MSHTLYCVITLCLYQATPLDIYVRLQARSGSSGLGAEKVNYEHTPLLAPHAREQHAPADSAVQLPLPGNGQPDGTQSVLLILQSAGGAALLGAGVGPAECPAMIFDSLAQNLHSNIWSPL